MKNIVSLKKPDAAKGAHNQTLGNDLLTVETKKHQTNKDATVAKTGKSVARASINSHMKEHGFKGY